MMRKGVSGGKGARKYETPASGKKEKYKNQAREQLGEGPGHFSRNSTYGTSNATKTHNNNVNVLAKQLEAAEEKAEYQKERQEREEEKKEEIKQRQEQHKQLSNKELREMAAWLCQTQDSEPTSWIATLESYDKALFEENRNTYVRWKKLMPFSKDRLDEVIEFIKNDS